MPPSFLTATRAEGVSTKVTGDLVAALGTVPDPRPGGGRRHPLGYVLGVLVAAFASAGFESFVGAAQWAAGASRQLLLAAWTAGHHPGAPEGERLAVAVDGKSVRGARTKGSPAPHLLAAATHDVPVVLAQRRVPGKTNEIPMVATLVDDLRAAGHDPADLVFTLDALHTQHATAALLHDAGAGYVMSVKGNQPRLRDAVIERLGTGEPARSSEHSRGHARTEERHLHLMPASGITFPGAEQVFRVIRYTGGLDGQRTRKEVVHGITNLRADQADATQLAALVRGHWSIENCVHWVRDVTYREDASRVRTGNAPAVLAAIRNVVTTVLRLAGAANIAAAPPAAPPASTQPLRSDSSHGCETRTNVRYDGALVGGRRRRTDRSAQWCQSK